MQSGLAATISATIGVEVACSPGADRLRPPASAPSSRDLIFDDFVGDARKHVVGADKKEATLLQRRRGPIRRRHHLLIRRGAQIEDVRRFFDSLVQTADKSAGCCGSRRSGTTILRPEDVQQPKIDGDVIFGDQPLGLAGEVCASERVSRTTASTGRPKTPPAWLTSSIAKSVASIADDPLTAIVPVSELRTPTLMGCAARRGDGRQAAWPTAAVGRGSSRGRACPSRSRRKQPAAASSNRRSRRDQTPCGELRARRLLSPSTLGLAGKRDPPAPESVANTAWRSASISSADWYLSSGRLAIARAIMVAQASGISGSTFAGRGSRRDSGRA